MEQRGKRLTASLADVERWAAEVFDDAAVPLSSPYVVEDLVLRECGYAYNATRDEDRNTLERASWTWPTACAWVAWRTFDGAASGVAAFRHWRGRVWREGVHDARPERLTVLPAAALNLRNTLEGGKLSAEAVRGGDVVLIGAGEWPRLTWEANAHGEVIEFDRLLMLGAPRYEGITLPRAAVMHLWPALDGWTPDGAVGPVEDSPAANEAPIDVDFVPVVDEARVPEAMALTGPPTDLGEWERIGAAVAQISPGKKREKRVKGSRKLIGRPFKEELERVLGHRITVAQADKAWMLYEPDPSLGRPSEMPRTNATE